MAGQLLDGYVPWGGVEQKSNVYTWESGETKIIIPGSRSEKDSPSHTASTYKGDV